MTAATTPPYDEAQSTAWLAWLAHHMRRRDLTIFQIENLQPNWLAGSAERALHLLLTRALWGVWAGLAFGLLSGLFIGLLYGLSDELISGLTLGLAFGLLVGLLVGLLYGLVELVTPIHKLDAFLRTRGNPTSSRAIGTIFFGLLFGLLFVPLFGLLYVLLFGLLYVLADVLLVVLLVGLLVGLLFGFVRTSRVALREAGVLIRTVESLQWSWRHVRQNAGKGALYGLLYELIIVLIFGLLYGLLDVLLYGLLGVLLGVLSGGLIGGLIGGFQPGAQELKTRPNQGIRLTLWSAVKIGLPAGFILGVLLGLLSQNIVAGVVSGAVIFFVIGGWYGGLDAVEHGTVRLILAWRGHAPLNYARFLDYAADQLNFLQKVGGGYV